MTKGHKGTGELYRMIFDHASVAMYVVAPNGEFVAANSACATLFGFESPEELAAHAPNLWKRVYGASGRESFGEILLRDGAVANVESRAYRKDGSPFLVSESVRAAKDEAGETEFFVGSVREMKIAPGQLRAGRDEDSGLLLVAEEAERKCLLLMEVIDELCTSHRMLEDACIDIVKDIVNALDSRRWWTRGRSERVAAHALSIADHIGLHEDEKGTLCLGALLHDIGQSVFCDEIVDKPVKLTPDEVAVVRKHPEQGAAVLREAKDLRDVVPMIKHHHERTDGRGYPDGLAGKAIPLGARIIHVATTFESMTADRPYRPAQKREAALREISRCAGSQFDPEIVNAALKAL